MNNYGIRDGYVSRPAPEYFPDVQIDGKNRQEDVYRVAAYLARESKATRLVDIGCGRGYKLVKYAHLFELLGIDTGSNIQYCRDTYTTGAWIDRDLENPISIEPSLFDNSVVVCADVIEHLVNPTHLVEMLQRTLDRANFVVLSTPCRLRTYRHNHSGPPMNPHHVREWSLRELRDWFKAQGFNVAWAGWTVSNNASPDRNTSMLILTAAPVELPELSFDLEEMTPIDVSVLIPAHNAQDTISKAILSALNQLGVRVEVIVCDDASTDDTGFFCEFVADRRLHIAHHAYNQGLAAALNTAAGVAKGRYFIELDADDWLEPGCLAQLVEALDANPDHGFAYGCTQYHGESDYLHVPRPFEKTDFYQAFGSLYAFLYRREAWDAGCEYRTTCEIDGRKVTIQDWDMVLQLIENMRYDGLALPSTLVLNYNHQHGSLTDFTNEHNAEVVTAFKERWRKVQAQRI